MLENQEITVDFIQDAINRRLKEVADEEFAAAHERIKERRDEVVAGVILRIEKQMDIQRMTDRVIFTIKT